MFGKKQRFSDEFYRHWNAIGNEFSLGRNGTGNFPINPDNIFEKEYVRYLEGVEADRVEQEAMGTPEQYLPEPMGAFEWSTRFIQGLLCGIALEREGMAGPQ